MADVTDAPSAAAAAVRVCEVCSLWLPGVGVAITAMASDAVRETLHASDEVIAQVEQLQYTLGEGPSLAAFTTGRPVLIPSVADRVGFRRWPVLIGELQRLGVAGLFTFPLRFGVSSIGVCGFYQSVEGGLDSEELALVLSLLDLATLALLELRDGALTVSMLDGWSTADGPGRRKVHQATGMLMAQLRATPEVAFARLRAHAFVAGLGIDQLAAEVVSRRVRLDPDPPAP